MADWINPMGMAEEGAVDALSWIARKAWEQTPTVDPVLARAQMGLPLRTPDQATVAGVAMPPTSPESRAARLRAAVANATGQPLTSPPDTSVGVIARSPDYGTEDLGRQMPREASVAAEAARAFPTATRRPTTAAPSTMDSRPYSEKVAGLQATMPREALSRPGGWTFAGGYRETGGRETTGREGTGTLSGLEQAMERRRWLEGRTREEQGREAEDQQIALAKAKLAEEQAASAARTADPFAEARIRAQGQYGGQLFTAEQKAVAAERAQRIFATYQAQAAEVARRMMVTAPGSPEYLALQQQYRDILTAGVQAATIELGEAPRYPQVDFLSSVLGLTGGGTSSAAPATTAPK